MTLFDHPIWRHIAPYAHIRDKRTNLDFLQMPDQLRELALGAVVNCVACFAVISPLRARAKSNRSRIADTALERRLFYAPTCPTDKDSGCSRSKAAQDHKDRLMRMFGLEPKHEIATRVVNLRVSAYDVYIGRAGHGQDGYFGNPYPVDTVCTRCQRLHKKREDTIPCFKAYFDERVGSDVAFRDRVLQLKGKTLGCFCAPGRCHGEVYVDWLDGD